MQRNEGRGILSAGRGNGGRPVGAVAASSLGPTRRSGAAKAALLVIGSASVAAGAVGAFVPVLPTTPFLLLSAACYLRASEKMYRWLLSNRVFGAYLSRYLKGEGLPLSTKIATLALLWPSLGVSAFVAIPARLWWARLILLAVGLGVTIHLIALKTYRAPSSPREKLKLYP